MGKVRPSAPEPQRCDINLGGAMFNLSELCRSLRELGFDRRVYPQLALWATDMPPAMRAFANVQSNRTTNYPSKVHHNTAFVGNINSRYCPGKLNVISVLRFFARLARVVFGATGFAAPMPVA